MTDHSGATPKSERATDHLQGHWVLARAGKRVLRPGGRELTQSLLAAAAPHGRRVVELAPGLGLTAADILDAGPRSYVAVEQDAAVAAKACDVIGSRGRLVQGDAAHTGLPDGSADLVIGEAMLTMQSEAGKKAIIAEAHRLLTDGGRYAIHELGLKPDDVEEAVKRDVQRSLAQAIKVNARPLTMAEWRDLLQGAGFVVEWSGEAEMALLQPRRLLADEGISGAARILRTMVRDRQVRQRILTMRATFRRNQENLCAVALVARRADAPVPSGTAAGGSIDVAVAADASRTPRPAQNLR